MPNLTGEKLATLRPSILLFWPHAETVSQLLSNSRLLFNKNLEAVARVRGEQHEVVFDSRPGLAGLGPEGRRQGPNSIETFLA